MHSLTIVACAVAAVGCLAPASVLGEGADVPTWIETLVELVPADKILHLVGFFVLGLLVYRSIRLTAARSPVVLTAILVMTYATSLELLQGLVASRSVELGDALANLTGVLLSVGLVGFGDSRS